ncbi:uncharacterized protein [Argopecten irradians]|uniref:uncharacterized protein n=1 Tax=Argopecten irradians TaxID=31199 RepID=UPI00372374D2
MAALKLTLASTQRAFSRSSAPFLPVQENGSLTKILPKRAENRIKMLAIAVVVVGLSTSTLCCRKLSCEKQDCNPLKRLFVSQQQGKSPHIIGKKDYPVSIGVKE